MCLTYYDLLFLFQTHPNIDKELFRNSQVIGMKNSAKPFPIGVDVGVLKWRFQTPDESYVPLLSMKCLMQYFNV